MADQYTHDSADYDSSYGPDYGYTYRDGDGGGRRGGRGVGNRFAEFVRTRRTEHWVMFAAGVVIGAILG